MIWLGPTTSRELHAHQPDGLCIRHCYSCHIDQHFNAAFEWCIECGHGYQTLDELKAAYLAESPWNRWDWQWWRIRLTPKWKLHKRITFCPLCLHDF